MLRVAAADSALESVDPAHPPTVLEGHRRKFAAGAETAFRRY